MKEMGQINFERNVTIVEGLYVITTAAHGDNHGYFTDIYSQSAMEEVCIKLTKER